MCIVCGMHLPILIKYLQITKKEKLYLAFIVEKIYQTERRVCIIPNRITKAENFYNL